MKDFACTMPFAPLTRFAHVISLGAVQIGTAALRLGAGRRTTDDEIDHSVGIVLRKKCGDEVASGDTVAEIHARDEAAAEAAIEEVLAAYELGEEAPPERSVILDVIAG